VDQAPDEGTKMAYALVGAVLGAIVTRIFVLLKRRAARSSDRGQMAARLEQLAL
jgi:hypothetical protein